MALRTYFWILLGFFDPTHLFAAFMCLALTYSVETSNPCGGGSLIDDTVAIYLPCISFLIPWRIVVSYNLSSETLNPASSWALPLKAQVVLLARAKSVLMYGFLRLFQNSNQHQFVMPGQSSIEAGMSNLCKASHEKHLVIYFTDLHVNFIRLNVKGSLFCSQECFKASCMSH